MKKLICLCLAALLLLTNLPTVRADVIFVPMGDDFFDEHRDECAYHDRYYTAQGPNGDVTVYESPISDRVIKTVDNGETLWVSYVYTDSDGTQWGCTGGWDDENGWVPMPYLALVYDHISFAEEYGHTFLQEAGELDKKWQGKEIYFWEYPGCPEPESIELQWEHMPSYDCIYVDENGSHWGQINYYYGLRDLWFNLDTPDADFATLYPNGVEEPTQPIQSEPTEPTKRVDEIKPQPDFDITIVVICVAAVMVVSALLLILLKRKR